MNNEIKPVGWFNPHNDHHGYQQVAKEYEGTGDTIPLYSADALAKLRAENERANYWKGVADELGKEREALTDALAKLREDNERLAAENRRLNMRLDKCDPARAGRQPSEDCSGYYQGGKP